MAAEQEREQKYLKGKVVFKRNATLLFNKMVKMDKDTQKSKTELVDEMLHSIFFLGKINNPKISPEEIFGYDADLLHYLKETYPQPFRLYSSTLPRRSPFSCVLDMVVHLKGQENEDDIIRTLRELVTKLMRDGSKDVLFSSTICISAANSRNAVKHYGVSMSSKKGPVSKIMIAASCLSFWEEHVAHAVMSNCRVDEKIIKKEDFCVNIKLPAGVRCDAFKLTNTNTLSPCSLCKEMFGLDTTEPPVSETGGSKQRLYGNCAEAESLSNLLREREVRERVQRIGNCTEVNKKRLRCEVNYLLTTELRNLNFAWDGEFYIAKRAEKPQ